MTKEALKNVKVKTEPIFRKYGVIKVGIFGSFARGQAKKDSDIDFLVTFGRDATLFTLGGLQYELEKKLKREIDLVSSRAIKKDIEPNIRTNLVNLYEKRQ